MRRYETKLSMSSVALVALAAFPCGAMAQWLEIKEGLSHYGNVLSDASKQAMFGSTVKFNGVPNASPNTTPSSGRIVVENTYGNNPVYSIQLFHPQGQGNVFGNWVFVTPGPAILLHNNQPVVLANDWGIRIIFQNGVASQVQRIDRVGSYKNGTWLVSTTRISRTGQYECRHADGTVGVFTKLNDRSWIDREGKVSYQFVTRQETEGFVELFDASRNFTLRLANDGSASWTQGNGWHAAEKGKWVAPTR